MDYGIIIELKMSALPEAFIRNPDYVNNFYNERRRIINDSKIKPNKAHKSLAMLEKNAKMTLC